MLGSSSKLARSQASEAKRIRTSTNLRRFEAHRGLPKNWPQKQNVLARARTRGASRLIEACPRPGLGVKRFSTRTHPRLSETHRSLSKPRPRRQIILARAQARAAWKLIEAWWRPGFGGKTYWHEHEPEALRGSSRLAQEQASEAKRIGTSKNPRRVEAHRGVPKARPRQQNALARAHTEAAGTRSE